MSTTMPYVSLNEAQTHLPDLIAGLKPGEELEITVNDRTVARLVAEPAKARKTRLPGSALGKLVVVAEDDDHLRDFKDYMP